LAEVITVVAIIFIAFLLLLSLLPRQREKARGAGCQENLRRIGTALTLYAQEHNGRLPPVPEFGPVDQPRSPGPLASLLGEVGSAHFSKFADPKKVPPRRPGAIPPERVIQEFLCASDPVATSARFPAPVSYRACGGPGPNGQRGIFASADGPSLAAIQGGPGLDYAAAFCERLVGNGASNREIELRGYLVNAERVTDGRRCPAGALSALHGDAGRSWLEADWRSTFYNHALTPNAKPSCISSDGISAYMGASSGHSGVVNLLVLGGGVRTFTSRVDPEVWRSLAASNPIASPSSSKPTDVISVAP
jgi:hypothetical protein